MNIYEKRLQRLEQRRRLRSRPSVVRYDAFGKPPPNAGGLLIPTVAPEDWTALAAVQTALIAEIFDMHEGDDDD